MRKLSISRNAAVFDLALAGILWGFAFVATIWCFEFLGPSAIITYRFLGAFLVGILFVRPSLPDLIKTLKESWLIGVFLAATLILQTYGLTQTSATKSAFITILYVVLVPFLSPLVIKQAPIARSHYLWMAVALLGTALMLQLNEVSLNTGDALTLACAFFAAFHIVWMGKAANLTQHPFLLNIGQCFWCGIIALPLMFFEQKYNLEALNLKAWLGLLSLTLGASLVAFYLQVRSQKILTPAVAALLFLLESPFSAFFSVWLLGEKLSGLQLLGGALIFVSCYLASLAPSKVTTP